MVVLLSFDSAGMDKQCCFKFNKMNEYEQMIDKLTKINFTERDGDKFISEDGFTFMWDIKMSGALRSAPLQLVIHIHYKKVCVAFWGCCDDDDTLAFTNYIARTKTKIYDNKYAQESRNLSIGKSIFESL